MTNLMKSRRFQPSRRFAGCALAAFAATAMLTGCSPQTLTPNMAQRDAQYALAVLDRAPEQGYPAGAFGVRQIHAAIARRDPQASQLLRAGVIAYARAEHGLLIPAKAWPAAWGQRAANYDPAPAMDAALRDRTFKAWLDAQTPAAPLYRTMAATYAQLLTAPQTPQSAALATALRASLERLRWLPRDEPPTRIDINIASATLIYVVDGQPRLTMRTASGKPGDETPTLTSKIDNIVLHPPWNVPSGIAKDELLPKGREYLESHRFLVKDDGGLQQAPGPDSALGLVKFDFPNPYAVYLHDTPSKGAFDKDQRAVSHGCVRLERAMDLANLLLQSEAGWSAQRIQDVVAGGETTTVTLRRPVPVRLLYLTAVPQNGAIVSVPDIYGWDPQLLALLDTAARGSPV